MTSEARKLLQDALHLTDQDRADLAANLIESMDRTVDEGADEAWESEVTRRMKDLDGEAIQPVPWPEARRKILGTSDDSACA